MRVFFVGQLLPQLHFNTFCNLPERVCFIDHRAVEASPGSIQAFLDRLRFLPIVGQAEAGRRQE